MNQRMPEMPRKGSDSAQSESEATLRSFYDSTPLMMGVIELLSDDIRHLSGNAATAAFLETSPPEIEGRLASTMGIPPELLHMWVEACLKCDSSGVSTSFEYPHELTAETRWLSATVSPIADGETERIRFSYVIEDITERKQVEDKLRESEKQSRAWLECSPICTKIVDLDLNLQYISSSGVIALKIEDTADVYGKPYPFHFYPESFKTEMTANLIKARETGEVITQEASVVDVDGNELWFQSTIVPVNDDDGQIEYLIVVSIDTTQRRMAENRLRESEAKYRGLLDNMVGGVIIHNHDTSIEYCNLQACQILGVTIEQVTGKDAPHPQWEFLREDGSVLPPEEYPANQVLTTGKILHNMILGVNRPQQNDIAWVLVNGFPIYDTKRDIPKAAITFIDISDRKLMEEQLHQSEKMQAIGQLAGGIAHDFNNQLAGVLGYADMLEKHLEDDTLSRYAINIGKAARRAADLTNQLLAFSRKGKNLSVVVELHRVLADVISILEHSIDKRINIQQLLKATPATTIGDPTQIQNAILNIALNARDAMGKQGELIFETDIAELDTDFCKNQPYEIAPGNYITVSISDNGCGMDAEAIKHIFEPFYTTKKIGEGTGMGLASVYGTVQSHNGAITVSSAIGQGTTFCLYLPHTQKHLDEPNGQAADAPITGTARILLVDDEELVRTVVAEMLEDIGYTVSTCADGKQAIKYYETFWKEIDLVILDMIMPELGGRDTFAVMKKINPGIRAILSSGYNIDGEAHAILSEGVMAFVGKPFKQKKLAKKVAEVLRRNE
jgi:PAS domain S-box-containing protein